MRHSVSISSSLAWTMWAGEISPTCKGEKKTGGSGSEFLRSYDNHQSRLLNNELKEIDAIKSRKVKAVILYVIIISELVLVLGVVQKQ